MSVESLGYSGRRVSSPSSPVLSALSRVPRHGAYHPVAPSGDSIGASGQRTSLPVASQGLLMMVLPGSSLRRLGSRAMRFGSRVERSGGSGYAVTCWCAVRLGRVGGGEACA
jgi:hypothetical protein